MSNASFSLQGKFLPQFEQVAVAFAENFVARGEVGASCSIQIEGETVVDIWGGYADPQAGKLWQEDTISLVFSCTKAATALCAQLLIDRGLLILDEKVTHYWPEFGQGGKEDTTVSMMLGHASPVPVFRQEVLPGAMQDFAAMTALSESEEAHWTPGAQHGYHMINFGWTVGELVRRVSGMSLDAFFNQEIREVLGIDFWMCLPPGEDNRVAKMIPFLPDENTPITDFLAQLMEPESDQHKALFNLGGLDFDSPEGYRAIIGGGGGLANARALAQFFTPLANDGNYKGNNLISKARIDDMRRPLSQGMDSTLLIPTRFGQGFMLRMDNRSDYEMDGMNLLIPDGAFGHVGMGGSVGFADPAQRLSMGYSMIKMGGGILLNERGQSLVKAAYAALEKGG